jgi:hypothetical protein
MENLKLNRYVGCEFEGYINSNPRHFNFVNAEKKADGSLRNTDWTWPHYEEKDWGIEIACDKTKDIDQILDVFDQMVKRGWHVDDYAGTHVHIDAADYTTKDFAKMMMFGSSLPQALPFMFVQNYRWQNMYCKRIKPNWAGVFTSVPVEEWIESNMRLEDFLMEKKLWRGWYENEYFGEGFYCEKYNWINVHTFYNTVEFRLFHAVESKEDIINFVSIAHGMVELVKNSTVEQLQFIASEISKAANPYDMGTKFMQAIGIDYLPPIIGSHAYNLILESTLGSTSQTA